MNSKPGRERPRVSQSLPHSSWNLDRPILLNTRHSEPDEARARVTRRVTPEEIWAVVDAVG